MIFFGAWNRSLTTGFTHIVKIEFGRNYEEFENHLNKMGVSVQTKFFLLTILNFHFTVPRKFILFLNVDINSVFIFSIQANCCAIPTSITLQSVLSWTPITQIFYNIQANIYYLSTVSLSLQFVFGRFLEQVCANLR